MKESIETFRQKAMTILTELAGERAPKLRVNGAHDVIAGALKHEFGLERADDVAFHLSDWAEDAAFLIALHLFPERFDVDEIRAGVMAFLIHAPNHINAAAHLAGWPLQDVFGVGIKLEK